MTIFVDGGVTFFGTILIGEWRLVKIQQIGDEDEIRFGLTLFC